MAIDRDGNEEPVLYSMELIKNDRPGATTDTAVVDGKALAEALLEFTRWAHSREHYARLFDGAVAEGRVRVSRCAFEYLAKLAARSRLMMLARAMPFAIANDRPRVICDDFALATGARTEKDVEEWLNRERLRSRSTTPQTLRLPEGYA